MRTDLETILRDLEVIDHKLDRVELLGVDMDPSAIVYDVSHVRTILLGAINRLDTVVEPLRHTGDLD